MHAKNVYAMSSQPTSHEDLGVAGIMRQCNLALLMGGQRLSWFPGRAKSNNSIPRFLVMAGFLGRAGRQGGASSQHCGRCSGGSLVSFQGCDAAPTYLYVPRQ